jgi:hypothetical protein
MRDLFRHVPGGSSITGWGYNPYMQPVTALPTTTARTFPLYGADCSRNDLRP